MKLDSNFKLLYGFLHLLNLVGELLYLEDVLFLLDCMLLVFEYCTRMLVKDHLRAAHGHCFSALRISFVERRVNGTVLINWLDC